MLIDLTHTIVNGLPPFPGDAETELVQSRVFQKDGYNNHQLNINMHAGTHIDGPMHLTDCYEYLNEVSLESLIGEGCLLDVRGQEVIDYKEEYEQLVGEHQIIVLYTGHSQRFGEPGYFTDYPVLTPAFADLLVRKKTKMVALDTPSPDKDPYEVHKRMFENRILIAENLTNVDKLLDVQAFEIIALPLKIRADSSIARIVARVL